MYACCWPKSQLAQPGWTLQFPNPFQSPPVSAQLKHPPILKLFSSQ
jgi:hypothetical protein